RWRAGRASRRIPQPARRRRAYARSHGLRRTTAPCEPPPGGDPRLADERLDEQQHEADRQRDLEAVLEAPLEGRGELALLHRSDVVAVELAEPERGALGVQVDAARVACDLPERLLVEPRLHHLPLAVLHVPPGLGRHQLTLGGADADGIDLDAALLGALGRLLDVALVALAVGDEDECLVVALAALERLEARGDRGAEVRAAARDDADVDRIDALAEGALVDRE